ncbi:MAG: HesA/MoeB/ThiF family protein [Cytophagaceae bacterium]|jgi:adenylyltransferase/sulfurtransferase|nr:HesA/MoeB/ThiF family protein [Cytophagaceae bacterium]
MMNSSSPRYQRQVNLPGFGVEAQARLQASSVLVVGAGGLGAPVLLYLAAAGIGKLGILEGDQVEESNLHRQILFKNHHIGQSKAEVAFNELVALNPDISIHVYPHFLNADNALSIIAAYDVIVDATDNMKSRYLINDACVIQGKPFVYGAIHQWEGQVGVFNYLQGPTYRCLFPNVSSEELIQNCSEAGVLGVLPGIIGSMQASEVIKICAGLGDVLNGILLTYDLKTNHQWKFKIPVQDKNRQLTSLGSYTSSCDAVQALSFEEVASLLASGISPCWIDLREEEEKDVVLSNVQALPWSIFSANLSQIPLEEKLLLFCKSGKRSRLAAQVLMDRGFRQVYALKCNPTQVQELLHLSSNQK